MSQNGAVKGNSGKEVSQAQILVRRMLVTVVICDWNNGERHAEGVSKPGEWQTATGHPYYFNVLHYLTGNVPELLCKG